MIFFLSFEVFSSSKLALKQTSKQTLKFFHDVLQTILFINTDMNRKSFRDYLKENAMGEDEITRRANELGNIYRGGKPTTKTIVINGIPIQFTVPVKPAKKKRPPGSVDVTYTAGTPNPRKGKGRRDQS
jgi:hypothetical protein